jgi:hypothetical protein
MKAYKIQDDIVAAHNEEQAVGTWMDYFSEDAKSAGPIEEIDPLTYMINFEQNDGSFELGPLADIMPEHDPEVIIDSNADY